jgi:CHAT domain-containing protein/Tfp pilus assembly protein PilF
VADRSSEVSTLNRIGTVYYTLGEEEKALSYFNQALPIGKRLTDGNGEAMTLNGIALVDYTLGEEEKAQEYLNQALAIQRKTGDRRGEAATLTGIGLVYTYLGQQQKALDRFEQALSIQRALGDRRSEAGAMNNIGWAYDAMNQQQRALQYLNQALSMQREMGDLSNEAYTLDSIGLVYRHLGQKQKALDIYNQALPIERKAGNRDCEANTLWGMGDIARETGDVADALRNEVAALSLADSVGDPDLQGRIDTSLMRYFREQQHPEAAILFGMDAVNSFQQMRRNITGLDQKLQAGFVQSKSETYRELAELLVQTDRLAEAEHVLDLLKEQELKEVVRGAANDPAAKAEPLPLTSAQQKAQGELATPEQAAMALTEVSAEHATLLAKASRSSAEEARLKALDARIEAGNGEVLAFFNNQLYSELAQQKGKEDANALLKDEKSGVSHLQDTLAGLGPRVLGIRLLLGEQHAYAIVVTANAREKVELKATPGELRSKVLQVRDDLRSPASNPKPHLAELYAMVVAPLEPELKALVAQAPQAGQTPVPTLLWSLDGVLRYVPMAALYDGTRYMAERFNNVLFTPDSYGHMTTPVDTNTAGMRVLAMGLSKSYGGLPALPGVMPELEAVVRDPAVPASHGPMDGRLLPNDQFTLAALKAELGDGNRFPVVHIASHFVVETGGGDEPYLMLGGDTAGDSQGYSLTLSRMETSSISFHGTRLLTLSACSTAKGDTTANDGREMDSPGMIAQQGGAEAVIATLWDVNDASTSRLMSDFYSRWVKAPAEGKAEALRQAQLALLRGGAVAATQNDRGLEIIQEGTGAPLMKGYAHPFYWAPFVLIGNFQ